MAAIDFGIGANTPTGDLIPAAIVKLSNRLIIRGFDPGIVVGDGSSVADAMARIEIATARAVAAYVPPVVVPPIGTPTPTPGPTPTPAPAFTSQPSISPASGTVGQVYTLTKGAASNATSVVGRVLLNGAQVAGDVASYTSTAAGTVTYENTATGPSSPPAVASATATVAAVTPTLNTLTVSPSSATVGTPYSGTISGLTSGSSVALSGAGAAGLSIAGAVITGTPTTAGAINLVETLAGATGSPRTSSGVVTVAAANAPALVATPSSQSVAANSSPGSFVSNITNVPTGVAPTVSPNDGRFLIAGDATVGWKVVTGMSALSAGSVNLTVNATGANPATIAVTITAVVAPSLTAYSTSSETQAFSSAASGRGETVTANRLNRHDRLVRRLKATSKTINGAAVSMTNPAGKSIWQALRGLYIVGDTEAQWRTNLKSPGTNDLTVVGAPTFVAKEGVGGFTTTAYYDTGITLASMSATGASLGMQIAPTAVGGATGGESSNPDIGAYDGTAGLALWGLTTSTRIQARIFQTSASQAIGTTFFNGGGFMGAARRAANGAVHSTRHGVPLVSPTVSTAEVAGTYVPSTSTTTLCIGNVPGSAGASVRALSAVYFAEELTPDQETELTTAIQDYIYSVRWGDPFIYERGIGPANITADLVVYGLSQAALSAAYEGKRAGRTVALVGDWYDSQVWDVGGMPSNGLNWEDAKVFTKVGGVWRDMVSYANSIPATTNVDTQAAQSPEPRYINAAARRMLDPARSGSLLPGMDIPVHMTGGITGVTKTGAALNTMTTADGRTFTGKVFIDASYDGDLNYYSGAPVFTGREAAGTGLEAKNGFYTGTIEAVTDNTTALALDPYVTAGNPASGLLPDIVDVSAKVSGSQDTAHQAMNNRITMTTTRARYAPFDRVPPRNYNAMRYEVFGRQQAAATANAKTMGITGFIAAQNLSSGGTVQDANNGSNALSTDLPQSGERYAVAGADKAARLAVFNDINDYGRGLIYYFTLSGDSRIQTSGGIKSSLDGLGLDPFAHLDPGANGATWWPNRPYTREPTFMLKNTATIGSKPAVYDGNDIAATDGTAPRSAKTVTIANYRADVHALRRIVESGVVKVQGGVQDNTGGGSDNIAPIGMEYIMPDKSSVTNLLSPTAPSLTKTAYSVYRMEPTMAQAGQAAAQIAIAAIVNNVAVQDVDYGTDTTGVRGALLTNADVTRHVVLPQVN